MYQIPADVFEQGMDFEQYFEGIVNNKPVFSAYRNKEIMAGFTRRAGEAAALLQKLRDLPAGKIVAIVEDWCTDAFTTLGFWVRFAEELGWELRIFKRDSKPDLMSHFLKEGGARSIPVYAFYTADLKPVFWASGRHAKGEPFKKERLGDRKFDDLSTREKIVFRKALTRHYDEFLFEETVLDLLGSLAEHAADIV